MNVKGNRHAPKNSPGKVFKWWNYFMSIEIFVGGSSVFFQN